MCDWASKAKRVMVALLYYAGLVALLQDGEADKCDWTSQAKGVMSAVSQQG